MKSEFPKWSRSTSGTVFRYASEKEGQAWGVRTYEFHRGPFNGDCETWISHEEAIRLVPQIAKEYPLPASPAAQFAASLSAQRETQSAWREFSRAAIIAAVKDMEMKLAEAQNKVKEKAWACESLANRIKELEVYAAAAARKIDSQASKLVETQNIAQSYHAELVESRAANEKLAHDLKNLACVQALAPEDVVAKIEVRVGIPVVVLRSPGEMTILVG